MSKRRTWLMIISAIATIAIGVEVFLIANRETPINSVDDIAAAMKSVKSYRLTVESRCYPCFNFYNERTVGSRILLANSLIYSKLPIGQSGLIERRYQVYVDAANGKAEVINIKNANDQVIIGQDNYTKRNGVWSKSSDGEAIFTGLVNSVVIPDSVHSVGIFTRGASQEVDGVDCRLYTYSERATNNPEFSLSNRYWVAKDGIPRKMFYYEEGGTSSDTTTMWIERINEPVTITAPEMK